MVLLHSLALAVTLLLGATAGSPYQELFFPQTLDHFDPSSNATWSHRYLLNNDTWDGRGKLQNGCKGPILLYTGNEGDITAFWDTNGFMISELAPRWGALLVFPEQRFYGKSLPFGSQSFSAPHLRFLTTAQVLEDYVLLLAHLKTTLNAHNCPVIAFGGSYGGTLTALLRASHPSAVIGGLAASSELGYYDSDRWSEHGVDQYTFENIIIQDYAQAAPGCLQSIDLVTKTLQQASSNELIKTMHLCDDAALKPQQSSLFTYALEAFPQLDYPYPIPPLPASPVTHTCHVLLNATAQFSESQDRSVLIAAAASITDLYFGFNGSNCIGSQGIGGPGNTPGDGPGPGAWGYQSCTETLHQFSARELRNYSFNYNSVGELCDRLYGVRPDVRALATQFGGYDLPEGTAGVSHLIWSQGTLDPWHGWFSEMKSPPEHSNVYQFLLKGSAHHLDLKASHPNDPIDVTHARAMYIQIMWKWIEEASRC